MTLIKSADHAHAVIRLKILNGTLQPGARVVEADLALSLKSSRTPIREALRRLEAEGLVESLPHRGARVVSWTKDDLSEIYELRTVLEALAGQRAASRIKPTDLIVLEELCDQMDDIGIQPDATSRDEYSRLNSEYHEVIRQASGSQRLVSMLHGVVRIPLIVRTFHLFEASDIERSSAHHREIIAALSAGDAEWTGSVLRAHILAAKSILLKSDASS